MLNDELWGSLSWKWLCFISSQVNRLLQLWKSLFNHAAGCFVCAFSPTLYCRPISEFKYSTLNYLLILNGNFNGNGNNSSSNGNSRKRRRKRINLDIDAVNSKRNIIEFSDIVNKNKHLHECNAVDQPHNMQLWSCSFI